MLYCEYNCKKAQQNNCDLNSKSFCMRKFKLDNLYTNSLLTPIQQNHIDLRLDANGTDKEAFKSLKIIENDIENFVVNGNNLYIHSVITGNGKTAWAVRLMQSYFNKIWYKSDLECRGLFVHVPRFFLALKDAINEKNDYVNHIKSNILKADLVIFDEIGTKNLTSFESENLLNIINTRINEGKSNIYTSNLTPEELKETLGDRLYSRIVNLSTDITFYGQDKRI